jgi:hypothetical protein
MMGKCWENAGKMMGKCWENDGKMHEGSHWGMILGCEDD